MNEKQARYYCLLKELVPGAQPLLEALKKQQVDENDFLDWLQDDSFIRLAEDRIERYARLCYLVACAKLARSMMDDPSQVKVTALKFIAERFDPKYLPTTQVLHTAPRLPNFESKSKRELLEIADEFGPRWAPPVMRELGLATPAEEEKLARTRSRFEPSGGSYPKEEAS